MQPTERAANAALTDELVNRYVGRYGPIGGPDTPSELVPAIAAACVKAAYNPGTSRQAWLADSLDSFARDLGYEV